LHILITPEIRNILLKFLIQQYYDGLEVGLKLIDEASENGFLPF